MQSSVFGTRGARCRHDGVRQTAVVPDSHAEMKNGTRAGTIACPRAAVAARRPGTR
uniref:hypothetical protein n=1 Tax=Burkholderia anthina TaxID=179879 RepID=UPI001588B63B|nr:hypothetical protein [Burkholderia anthina]